MSTPSYRHLGSARKTACCTGVDYFGGEPGLMYIHKTIWGLKTGSFLGFYFLIFNEKKSLGVIQVFIINAFVSVTGLKCIFL